VRVRQRAVRLADGVEQERHGVDPEPEMPRASQDPITLAISSRTRDCDIEIGLVAIRSDAVVLPALFGSTGQAAPSPGPEIPARVSAWPAARRPEVPVPVRLRLPAWRGDETNQRMLVRRCGSATRSTITRSAVTGRCRIASHHRSPLRGHNTLGPHHRKSLMFVTRSSTIPVTGRTAINPAGDAVRPSSRSAGRRPGRSADAVPVPSREMSRRRGSS